MIEVNQNANGEIAWQWDDLAENYSQNVSNQLIKCARMNNWEQFTSLWQKKAQADTWTKLQTKFAQLEGDQSWKLKEKFARLPTHE